MNTRIPKLKFLQPDGMGIFLWFMRGWWEEETRKEAIGEARKTLRRYNRLGISVVNFFCFVLDGHWSNAHYSHLSPWKRDANGDFILNQFNQKWFKGYRAWMKLLKETGNTPLACAFMSRYCGLPFEKNINGVRGFWHLKALRFQVRFVSRIIQIEMSVFGKDHKPKFRMINEPAHNGNHEMLHVIADWHLEIYLLSKLGKFVELKNLFFCSGECEGAHAHFVERHKCPKCRPGETYGDGYFGGHFGDIREVQIINHGYSLEENIGDELYHYLGSAWRPPACLWCGGDGGAGPYMNIAKGHALYDDKGRMLWRQGNAVQTGRLVKKLYAEAKRHRKYVGYQITFFESLQGWPFIENFKRKNIHWARVMACVREHLKAF